MQQHIGRRLGAYQIVEQIGRGGMATVFKAYQPSMDRYVAIKILPSHLTEDESFVGRFTREARTLARLEHPHILPVHDYGEQEGTTYLVMRYVEAGTLKDVIVQEGPLELEQIAHVIGQVGRALDYAHSQAVIHRDIKPSNVLIDRQGNAFLTDFGIAKLVAESAQFTASGAIIGTPAYMSPEQSMGQPVDLRCDIYSLGVVLYELATGRVPFEAETPLAVLLKHINEPLPLPRHLVEGLPEAVERVILKALAKHPEDRFESAGAMVDALVEAVVAPLAGTVAEPSPAREGPTTLAWSPDGSVPGAVDMAASRPSSAGAAPTPRVDVMPPGDASVARPQAAEAEPPRRMTGILAPTHRRWLVPIGGAALVALLLLAVFVLWNPLGGEATPTARSEAQATPATAGQAQATTRTAVSQSATAPPAALPAQSRYAPGWTNYSNGNFVFALVRQIDTLWAGGDGGLVGWNVTDGTYTSLSGADGLASSRINDLLVDDEGMLWIATDAGVNRYDGRTMVTYGEVDGLDALWIQALFVDDTGGLWAGSRGGERGLNYYDGEGWGPPPIPPLPGAWRNVQALGGNDRVPLYVGLEDGGLALFDGEAWTLLTSADGLPSDEVISALLVDDSLWVSSDPALARVDLETGSVETIPQGGVQAMHHAASGEVWFGGMGRVLRFSPDRGDWQEFEAAPGSIPPRLVTEIVEDERGLWFGTYGGGVTLYDGNRWETWTTDDDVGGNWIEAIRQDGDGVLWFSHPGSGLSRYDPGDGTWQVFGQAEGATDWPSLPDIDSDGNLWIGESEELFRYDGQGWQSFTPPELSEEETYAIEIGPGDVQWLVTDRGLMRYEPVTEEWTTFTAADHPLIGQPAVILAASDGNVWLGGEEGLARYDGRAWSTPAASGSPPQFIEDLAEAPDGSLWVAADGELGHLADGRWSYHAWPSDAWLARVAVGPDGRVWAGYEGLGRYDPASGDWRLFAPADGLVHRLVQAIHVAPEGIVWIGTEGGLSRYVPPD